MFRGVNTDEAGSTKYLCIATFVTIALGTLHLTSLHGMTVHAVQTAIAWRVPLGPVLLKNVAEISNLDGNLQLLSYSTSLVFYRRRCPSQKGLRLTVERTHSVCKSCRPWNVLFCGGTSHTALR